ncbi:MAG: hypothetical protein IPH34_07660 [Chitinophagaceae bacterium]|nr:hypothetical protein [Chitinophagaceae bacterium]
MIKMNAGIWIGIFGGVIGLLVGISAVVTTGGKEGIYIGAGMLVLFGGMFYLFYRLFSNQCLIQIAYKKQVSLQEPLF